MKRRSFFGVLAGALTFGFVGPRIVDAKEELPALGDLWAAMGETVTCENGHPICDVAHDLHYGQMQNPRVDWANFRQPQPEIGTKGPVLCTECGAPWFSGAPKDQVPPKMFHFADGWR